MAEMIKDKKTVAINAIRSVKSPEGLIKTCRRARGSGILSRNELKALKRKESKRIRAADPVLA